MNPLNSKPFSENYTKILEKVKSLPANNPDKKKEFLEIFEKNDIVILTGETGSGKTTQIPKQILEFYNYQKNVIVSQPRILAAQMVATRVSNELDVKLGEEVGLRYRGFNQISDKSKLSFVTDGFLNNLVLNNYINNYDVIVVDEAHERSRQIDLLLLLIKKLHEKDGKKPKVVIMSATINKDEFINYFSINNTKVGYIHITGRTFPVESFYLKDDPEDLLKSSIEKIVLLTYLFDNLKTKNAFNITQIGDILVFLNTKKHIDKVVVYLKNILEKVPPKNKPYIVGLYSGAPKITKEIIEDPTKLPQGHDYLIVISTNVAETSITIPNLKYVIDGGQKLDVSYDPINDMYITNHKNISKAGIKQRIGRAGRVTNGFSFHIYNKENFDKRNDFETPKILNEDVSELYLQLLSISKNVPSMENVIMNLLSPPSKEQELISLKQLFYLGAVDIEGELTNLGQIMSKLPVEPCYAKMCIMSIFYNVSDDICKICSMLSISNKISDWILDVSKKNPKYDQIMKLRKEYSRGLKSDFSLYLKIYNDFIHNIGESHNAYKYQFNHSKFKDTRTLYFSLSSVLKRLESKIKNLDIITFDIPEKDKIQFCILSGLFYHCVFKDKNNYIHNELYRGKQIKNSRRSLFEVNDDIICYDHANLFNYIELEQIINISNPLYIIMAGSSYYNLNNINTALKPLIEKYLNKGLINNITVNENNESIELYNLLNIIQKYSNKTKINITKPINTQERLMNLNILH